MKPIALLLCLLCLLPACRSVKKLTASADSSASSQSVSEGSWQREIIREFLPYGPPKDSVIPPPPLIAPKPSAAARPIVIREIIRERGSEKTAQSERVEQRSEEKAKEKETDLPEALFWLAAILLAMQLIQTVATLTRRSTP